MSDQSVRDAFRDQARSCAALGSPFTAALCASLARILDADHDRVAARVLGWPGDPTSRADSVPLRLCGALHALVLTGADPAMAATYRARVVDETAVLAALLTHEDTVLDWLDSPPQTNEVARSAAIIAAARFLKTFCRLPIRALELGASAGLNLNFGLCHLSPVPVDLSKRAPSSPDGDPIGVSGHDDRPDQVFLRPDWHGDAPTGDVDVIEAEGVDLRPIDPITDALRLMAYCWADQDARLARLRAALALAHTHPPRVAAGDAAGWLQDRLSRPAPGRLTLVYHTVAAQYFPQSTQAACEAALQGAAGAADATAPVAHFAMEADGGEGAALTLRLWDGHARGWHLGRGDFHGRWVRWNPIATQGLGEGRADR